MKLALPVCSVGPSLSAITAIELVLIDTHGGC